MSADGAPSAHGQVLVNVNASTGVGTIRFGDGTVGITLSEYPLSVTLVGTTAELADFILEVDETLGREEERQRVERGGVGHLTRHAAVV